MTYADYYLQHHGIKGQKWGVRRFQNEDGSLTAAGRERYGYGSQRTSFTQTGSLRKAGKHEFEDKSQSKFTRKDEAKAAMALGWGSFAATAAANFALAGMGYLSPRLLAGSALSLGLAAISTGELIVGNIQAKKADQKEQQFKEEREKNPIDKTTGFHKKTTKMTPEEDMERVNPAYKNWDDNTSNNCVLCTMSMELRRRGYDVQAKKANDGYDGNELVKDWFKGAKPKQSDGSLSDNDLFNNAIFGGRQDPVKKQEMIANTIKEITSQKRGARGQITFQYDGALAGHSVAYANENGTMVIYDSQANKKYSGKDAEKYLEKAARITVTRLDNCEINTKYIKEVAE